MRSATKASRRRLVAAGGRCYECQAPISLRYPLAELSTGLLFAAMTWHTLDLNLASALPVYLYFTAVGVALTVIDFEY